MCLRRLAAALVVAGSFAGIWAAAGLPSSQGTGTPAGLTEGKRLYRQYCGQCHALTAALAAGFGSSSVLGLNGGPGFDNLRVPFNLSVVAVTTPFAGHEVVNSKLRWTQVKQVATFVAVVTKEHRGLAQPIDD